ncbi:clasp N terminal-domain-containing protein [Cunninghamella echinulata]|nr:clasp N terminal-domain-containing protein [Cunninghamella echinulata]
MIDKSVYSKKKIYIKSKDEMDREMKRIQVLFSKKESEDNWQQFDQALNNIKQWATNDKIHRYPGFVDHIKLLHKPIISSLTSERTRLATTAHDLLKELSKAMQRKYELIHDLFAPTLIKLFARTNKVHMKNALTCYKSIIEHSKIPRNTKKLCMVLRSNNNNNKETNNKSVRYCVTECLNTIIQVNATADLIKYVDDIENAIKSTAMDPAPDVRSSIRMCYKLYCEKIPDHATRFSKTLSTDILKYLQVISKSRSEISTSSPSLKRSTSSSSLTKREQVKTKISPSTSTSSISSTKSIRMTSGLSTLSLSSTVSSNMNTTANSNSNSSSNTPSLSKTNMKRPRLTTATASYLSPTSSSSAKAISKTTTSSKLSSLTPLKPSTSLQMKYLGKKNLPTSFSLKMAYKMKRPSMIQGMRAGRVAKSSSSPISRTVIKEGKEGKEEKNENENEKYNILSIPSPSTTTKNEYDTTLKRSLPDEPLKEEDINQKKLKVDA